ncbi:hypothetical protein RCL1_005822 [Eukaryota sp. TZLM3-RCL]
MSETHKLISSSIESLDYDYALFLALRLHAFQRNSDSATIVTDVLIRKGDFSRALEWSRSLSSPKGRFLHALALFNSNDSIGCINHLLDRTSVDSALSKKRIPNGSSGLFLLAKALHAVGRSDQADKVLNSLLAHNPNHFPAFQLLSKPQSSPLVDSPLKRDLSFETPNENLTTPVIINVNPKSAFSFVKQTPQTPSTPLFDTPDPPHPPGSDDDSPLITPPHTLPPVQDSPPPPPKRSTKIISRRDFSTDDVMDQNKSSKVIRSRLFSSRISSPAFSSPFSPCPQSPLSPHPQTHPQTHITPITHTVAMEVSDITSALCSIHHFCFTHQGNSALRLISQLPRYEESSPDVILLKARALISVSKFHEAVNILWSLFTRDPDFLIVPVLSCALWATNDLIRSETLCRKLKSSQLHGSYYHFAMGNLNSLRKLNSLAVQSFTSALDRVPAVEIKFKSLILALKGAELVELEDIVGAKEAFSHSLGLDPKCTPAITGLAQLEVKAGRFIHAISQFKKVLLFAPNNTVVLTHLGYSYYLAAESQSNLIEREELFNNSIKFLNQAIEEDPKNGAAMLHLAKLYQRIGEFDSAKSFVNRAISLDSKDPTAFKLSCEIDLESGNKDAAFTAIIRASVLNPNDAGIASLLRVFHDSS